MKTLLIHGQTEPPARVRDIIRAGSTTVDEVSTTELSTYVSREGFGVDRVVIWAAPDDAAVRTLATAYSATDPSGRDVLYVTPSGAGAPAAVGRDRYLSWPDDEEKLRLLFQTGG